MIWWVVVIVGIVALLVLVVIVWLAMAMFAELGEKQAIDDEAESESRSDAW